MVGILLRACRHGGGENVQGFFDSLDNVLNVVAVLCGAFCVLD